MIEVKNLTKRYGDQLAVSDLSFTIEKGHVYGFLGPNGAGKSTTMNIMTGCLAATDGEVKIGGHDIYEEPKEAKKMIGYLPEIPPLYMEQTPREYLYFIASAKGIKKQEREENISRVIEETHIEEVADRLIKQLSKGYRQRVGIAQALLGNPEVIILDEPTVGLDPVQIIEIRDLIKELGEKHTVILSSHILSEVQAICEKVLIIYQGKLVAFDTPENLSQNMSDGTVIEIICEANEEQARNILASVSGIKQMEFIKEESTEDEENLSEAEQNQKKEPTEADDSGTVAINIRVSGEEVNKISKDIFYAFAKAELALIKLNPIRASLEDIYLELTEAKEEK